MKKSILFVCHGNICRSPVAEYILKYLTNNEYIIESRSTSRDEIGNDIYPNSKQTLIKHNIPFKSHKATQITKEDYDKFDLIVCFDENNITNLKKMGFSDKAVKLLDNDIEDPWYTRNFEKVYNEIYSGCIKLLDNIKK